LLETSGRLSIQTHAPADSPITRNERVSGSKLFVGSLVARVLLAGDAEVREEYVAGDPYTRP
jgi:hypothetical protein